MNLTLSRASRAAAALLAISLPGAALPAQAGKVVKKPEFTITLPDGWVEAPPQAMAKFNANVARAMAKLPKAEVPQFQYAFQPAKQTHWLAGYPYIVVRVKTGQRIAETAFTEIEHLDMSKVLKKETRKLPLLRKLKMGKPLYDPSTHTIWLTGELPGRYGVPLRVLSATIATKDGFVRFMAYAPKAKFASYYAVLHRIMASAVIPAAMRY